MDRKFWFGKYKGEPIINICKLDKNYIKWCLNNIEGFKLTTFEEGFFFTPEEPSNFGCVYEEFDREATYDMMMNFD